MLDWLKWVTLTCIGVAVTFVVAQGFTAHRTNLVDSQNTALETVSSVLNQFGDKTDLTSKNLAEELSYELSREMTQNFNVDVAYDFFNPDGSLCDAECEFIQFRIDLSNGKTIVSSMHKKFQLSVKE